MEIAHFSWINGRVSRTLLVTPFTTDLSKLFVDVWMKNQKSSLLFTSY
ncbi:7821_t:CDS:2 [Entrophospora sp. SA101]|nr:7821_t:CDS:2 [Entrophospora sp. SA101]